MSNNTQSILAGIALIVLGAMGFVMIFFPVPKENANEIIFILGALSGAVTTTGVGKVASGLTKTGDVNVTTEAKE